MGRLRKNQKGFTLLELLIVIVILGVLAGLAVPVYQPAIEKARSQEALTCLSAARESMIRYFSINGTYVGATFATLDYDPNLLVGGQTVLFTYTIPATAAVSFTITATRNGGVVVGTVSINQAGVLTKTGVYA